MPVMLMSVSRKVPWQVFRQWLVCPIYQSSIIFFCTIAVAPVVNAVPIDELTREQAEQIADNFNALKDTLGQGKDQIENLQRKLETIKKNKEWLNHSTQGKQLQKILSTLEKQGLSRKLQSAYDTLDMIEQGANTISDQVDKIQTEYEKVANFYDKWHPDPENPVRSLELVANSLAELESIIQSIDPSPDNVLTKPITSFIAYYKEASKAFAGALTKINKQIDERRGNCIGTGCENISDKGKKFETKFARIGPAWLYRKISDAEVWIDGGGRAFIWRTAGWVELQGGLARFDEVYHGWHLAHGEVISTGNLIGRMNSNYKTIIAAKTRANRYWPLLNSNDGCTNTIFKALKKKDFDKGEILKKADHREDKFIAQYMFRNATRKAIDGLIKTYEHTLLVTGNITDQEGGDIQGARIDADTPTGIGSTVSEEGGWFSLTLHLQPDESNRQNASVEVSHEDYETTHTEQRLWNRCENWRISLVKKETDAELTDKLDAMRDVAARASAGAKQINNLCTTTRTRINAASSKLDELTAAITEYEQTGQVPVEGSLNLGELAGEARQLSSDAGATAKQLAETGKQISNLTTTVCEKVESLQTIDTGEERGKLFRYIKAAHEQAAQELEPFRQGFSQLRSIGEQAEALKSQVEGLTQTEDGEQQGESVELSQLTESARDAYSQAKNSADLAESKLGELANIRAEGALILVQAKQKVTAPDVESTAAAQLKQIVSFFEQISGSRDRVTGCVNNGIELVGSLDGGLMEATSKVSSLLTEGDRGDSNSGDTPNTILVLADEAISTVTIAERFFGPGKMENSISQSETCLQVAEASFEEQQENETSIALQDCNFKKAEKLLAGGKFNSEAEQKLVELKRNEKQVRNYYKAADKSFAECKYDEATVSLKKAYNKSRCEKTRNKLANDMDQVANAAQRNKQTQALFGQADKYYQKGQFEQSYNTLVQAKKSTVCKGHIAKIDDALEKVIARNKQKKQQVAGLECQAPRVPGRHHKTGEPMCLCPGNLMWSEKRQACVEFGVLAGDLMRESGIAESVQEGVDVMQQQTQSSSCTGSKEWCEKYERLKKHRGSIRSAPPQTSSSNSGKNCRKVCVTWSFPKNSFRCFCEKWGNTCAGDVAASTHGRECS